MKWEPCLLILFLSLGLWSCEEETIRETGQPDVQFLKIHFRYDFGNELNTFNQTYTKDLVLDGYITIPFWLTTAEQQQIDGKLEALDFFNLPDTILSAVSGDTVSTFDPNPGRQFLRAEHANANKEVSWYYPLPENDPAANAIIELSEFIQNLIHSKPDYQKLPAPRGGRI